MTKTLIAKLNLLFKVTQNWLNKLSLICLYYDKFLTQLACAVHEKAWLWRHDLLSRSGEVFSY